MTIKITLATGGGLLASAKPQSPFCYFFLSQNLLLRALYLYRSFLLWNSFFTYLKKTNSSAPMSCYSPEHLWTVLKLTSS